jgi:crotonobetainyl-CoA:carnitine CoA-transferase CaiB-like acyl-CoA transferase
LKTIALRIVARRHEKAGALLDGSRLQDDMRPHADASASRSPAGCGKATARRRLQDLRILELDGLPASAYAARLFADFGADVVRIESSDSPAAQAWPRFDKNLSAARSAWRAFLNFNKRIFTRDDAAHVLVELGPHADVIFASGALAAQARAAAPSAVVVDVSWFGADGPYADYAACDASVRALAGCVQLVGPSEGPPMAAPDFQAAYAAGLWAFSAACAGVLAHAPALYETSVMEACVTLAEYQCAEAAANGAPQSRLGPNKFAPTYPLGVYPTADDWIGVTLVTPAQWRAFCDMLGLDDLAEDPTLVTGLERLPHAAALEARFIPALRGRPARVWIEEGLKRRIPIVATPSLAALATSENFRARGAIGDLHIDGKAYACVASPLRLTTTRPQAGGVLNAPSPDASVWRARQETDAHGAPGDPQRPLAGLRIVDFTMGWAGPLCARILADLGADVIKIESCAYPDWWRGVDRRPHVLAERLYEKTGRFAIMNRNKRGITLDLTKAEGVKIARALIAQADGVVENYSADVLPKLGLAPADLRAAHPRLVTLSMSAYGGASALRETRAYGSTLEQGSGLPRFFGWPGEAPMMGHPAYGDPIGGLAGAAAFLGALIEARATGCGQHIDLSQIECMMQMIGPYLLKHSVDGVTLGPFAQGHPDHALSGVYRCAGEDQWIHVACENDAQRDRLHSFVGGGLEALEATLCAWLRQRAPDEAMALLQAHGVIAAVVRAPMDAHDDLHLRARGFWQEIERAYIGRHLQPSMAFRTGSRPYGVRTPAPTLGAHNEDVLSQLLGLSAAEIAALERAGIIGALLEIDETPSPARKGAA